MDTNAKTLVTYNDHFSSYVDGTVQVTSGFQKEWLEYVLSLRGADDCILEVGSAFGRDAAFILEKGFRQLVVSDAFDAAIETLARRGFAAKKLNLLQDDIDDHYDLIIASAVFLHFNQTELEMVLVKLKDALTSNGILAFSVKQGQGEEWSDAKMGAPRFFHYWSETDLTAVLREAGYTVIDARHTDDAKWLHITCRVAT